MYRLAVFSFLLFSTPLVADTRSDIEAALNYYAEVWNENDMDAIAGYYHSSFVLVTDGGIISRAKQIEDISSVGARGGDRGELSHSNLVVKELGDKHAVAYGRTKLSFKDGSSLETWFSTVYENTPFGWKAVLTRN